MGLLRLPEETIAQICLLLPLKDAFALLSSCKEIFRFWFSERVWKSLFSSHFGTKNSICDIDCHEAFTKRIAIVNPRVSLQMIGKGKWLPAMACAYQGDSDILITGGLKGEISYVSTTTGKAITELKQCVVGDVMSLMPLPEQDMLIAVGSAGGCVYRLSDPKSPEYYRFSHGEAWVMGVAAYPKRDMFVTAGYDSTVRGWRLSTGESLGVLGTHSDRVMCVTAIDDCTFVSGSKDKTVKLWSIDAGDGMEPVCIRQWQNEHESFVSAIAAGSSNGASVFSSSFVSGDYASKLIHFDVRSPKSIVSTKALNRGKVGAVAIHGDGVIWSSGFAFNCTSLPDLNYRYVKDLSAGCTIWGIAVHPTLPQFSTVDTKKSVKVWTQKRLASADEQA